MKHLRREQLLCFVLLAGLGVMSWWAFAGATAPRRMENWQGRGDPEISSAEAAPMVIAVTRAQWRSPQSQASGRDWVFDLFTPPDIEFNEGTGDYRFKTSPDTVVVASTSETLSPAEPVLLVVRPEDYPLQLTGFVGEGTQARGIFENRSNGETLLLQTGDQVTDLALQVVDFQVRRTALEMPDSMMMHELRASATVRTTTGESCLLEQGVTAPGVGLLAVVRLGGETVELREGMVLSSGQITYRIDKIRLAPASVDVTKESTLTGATAPLVLIVATPPETNQP